MLIPMAVVVFLMAVGVVLLNLYFQKNLYAQKLREEELKNRHHADLLRHSIEVQEAEQKRIAQDLHDELGAALSIMRMHLVLLEQKKEGVTGGALKTLGDVRVLAEAAMTSTRNISHRLMPPQLEAFGLLKTLESVIRPINDSSKTQMRIVASAVVDGLPWAVSLGLYRISMELINNTIKHAHAGLAELHFGSEGRNVVFTYRDNGIGLEEMNHEGLGLKSIEARVHALDGSFTMDNSGDGGFGAVVKIPF